MLLNKINKVYQLIFIFLHIIIVNALPKISYESIGQTIFGEYLNFLDIIIIFF